MFGTTIEAFVQEYGPESIDKITSKKKQNPILKTNRFIYNSRWFTGGNEGPFNLSSLMRNVTLYIIETRGKPGCDDIFGQVQDKLKVFLANLAHTASQLVGPTAALNLEPFDKAMILTRIQDGVIAISEHISKDMFENLKTEAANINIFLDSSFNAADVLNHSAEIIKKTKSRLEGTPSSANVGIWKNAIDKIYEDYQVRYMATGYPKGSMILSREDVGGLLNEGEYSQFLSSLAPEHPGSTRQSGMPPDTFTGTGGQPQSPSTFVPPVGHNPANVLIDGGQALVDLDRLASSASRDTPS
jgi:hypothetical protein